MHSNPKECIPSLSVPIRRQLILAGVIRELCVGHPAGDFIAALLREAMGDIEK
jgi:hypothetical protein